MERLHWIVSWFLLHKINAHNWKSMHHCFNLESVYQQCVHTLPPAKCDSSCCGSQGLRGAALLMSSNVIIKPFLSFIITCRLLGARSAGELWPLSPWGSATARWTSLVWVSASLPDSLPSPDINKVETGTECCTAPCTHNPLLPTLPSLIFLYLSRVHAWHKDWALDAIHCSTNMPQNSLQCS